MEIQPIRTNDDLTAALARIHALWGKEPGTPEGDELDILVDLVEHYESKHFPIAPMETTLPPRRSRVIHRKPRSHDHQRE